MEYKRVETTCRDDGHTEEDRKATRERPEFCLEPRVVIAEHKEDDEYQRQADSDCYAGTEQESGYRSEWSHQEFPERLISPGDEWIYAKYALDQSAPAI